MRLTVESRRYRLFWVRDPGRMVLRVDTLAPDSDLRRPRWVEVDSLELPQPDGGTRIATDCWRGETMPSGDLVAHVDDADGQYFVDVHAAWQLDRETLRIHPVASGGIECRNQDWPTVFPDAPNRLRMDAITFRPSLGMARLYAILTEPDYPREDDVATLAVDSLIVGKLGGGSFLMIEVEPGRHRISTVTGAHENVLWIDAAADSSYFVEVVPEFFMWSQRFRANVKTMRASAARKAIRRAQMAASSWPGTPLGDFD
jgi:hypothetical protein